MMLNIRKITMNDKQIIAQCSDKGKFKVDSEIFEDENWEFTHGLFSTSNMEDWYMLKLAYAKYCIQRGDEREAFDIYTTILEEIVSNGHINEKYRDIANEAYSSLSKIVWNGSEYIYESGISVIEGYKELFEKL